MDTINRLNEMKERLPDNIVFDPWLTKLVGRDTYRVEMKGEFIQKLETESSEEHQIVNALMQSPVFMYSKIASDAVILFQALGYMGFRLVDTNLTLDKYVNKNQKIPSEYRIRFSTKSDLDQVVKIAEKNFTFSRYHLDPQIPKPLADTIKREWVRNYYMGARGDNMVVAETDGKIAGFLLLIYGNANDVIVDLVAVDKAYQKRGLGKHMIRFAEINCPHSRIITGTQVANIQSCRFYEKLGFRLMDSKYVFHYHNKPGMK